MRKKVRGPIAKTRRRMVVLKQRVPKEVLDDLLSKLKEGGATDLVWDEDGNVKPTTESSATWTLAAGASRRWRRAALDAIRVWIRRLQPWTGSNLERLHG